MQQRWFLGIFTGLVFAVVVLYPQARLIYLRGEHWNGNYAITDVDEVAYAAYLQSLIDGHPRVNDSYTKLAGVNAEDSPETLFSIQFLPPYAIAIPSRLAGISAPTAMVVVGVLAAFMTGLVLFWFIERVTANPLLALVGCFSMFFCGTLASGEGAILYLLDLRMAGPFFPGLRRYIPAFIMPVFFAFLALLSLLLTSKKDQIDFVRTCLAILLFGVLVFSYFYLWTAAAAVLFAIVILCLLFRSDNWKITLRTLFVLCIGCFAWLIPYALLLMNRAGSSDTVQLLEYTHRPDVARVPIYIAVASLLVLVLGIKIRRIQANDIATVFIAALAFLPFIVFNQQVVTGRSLQPIHYSSFIANYVAILSFVLAVWHIRKDFFSFDNRGARFALGTVALLVIGWGAIETRYSGRIYDSINIQRDMGYPAALKLRSIGSTGKAVLSFGPWSGDDLATTIPQPVLWARHQISFGMGVQESKRRYYQNLYYQGVTPEQLKDELIDNNIEAVIALFGAARYSTRLSFEHKKPTEAEIDSEVLQYSEYVNGFRPHDWPETVLSHVIVLNRRTPDLSNLDRWYARDAGEVLDGHTLYAVHLR